MSLEILFALLVILVIGIFAMLGLMAIGFNQMEDEE